MADDPKRTLPTVARNVLPGGVRRIPTPMGIAAMAGRLRRAIKLEQDIGATGEEYDAILDGLATSHAQFADHKDQMRDYADRTAEVIRRMIGDGSNHPPADGGDEGDGSKVTQSESPSGADSLDGGAAAQAATGTADGQARPLDGGTSQGGNPTAQPAEANQQAPLPGQSGT